MTDFQTIRLRAPYQADVYFRGRTTPMITREVFEIKVASLGSSDTKLVGTVKSRGQTIEFREIDEKLFRPLFIIEGCGETSWTSERLANEVPPCLWSSDNWRPTKSWKTPLLASPFRHFWQTEGGLRITESAQEHLRVHQSAPEAREEVRLRLEASATSGLKLIDNILFHETRTPGWTIHGKKARPGVPDLMEPSITLIDPRYSQDEIEGALTVNGVIPNFHGTIEIHEPSLFPNTIEMDAIASYCCWLYKKIQACRIDDFEPAYIMQVFLLIADVEKAVSSKSSLETCYPLLRAVAERDIPTQIPEDNVADQIMADTIKGARRFLELRRRLPARMDHGNSTDEIESAEISEAFGI